MSLLFCRFYKRIIVAYLFFREITLLPEYSVDSSERQLLLLVFDNYVPQKKQKRRKLIFLVYCLTDDNCAASDVPTAVLVLQTLCADLGVAVRELLALARPRETIETKLISSSFWPAISAVTGPATTVSLPPVTLNSGSSSVGSGSATAITSGAMSESTGLVTTTDATGGVVGKFALTSYCRSSTLNADFDLEQSDLEEESELLSI